MQDLGNQGSCKMETVTFHMIINVYIFAKNFPKGFLF